jgi:hypothetical protein
VDLGRPCLQHPAHTPKAFAHTPNQSPTTSLHEWLLWCTTVQLCALQARSCKMGMKTLPAKDARYMRSPSQLGSAATTSRADVASKRCKIQAQPQPAGFSSDNESCRRSQQKVQDTAGFSSGNESCRRCLNRHESTRKTAGGGWGRRQGPVTNSLRVSDGVFGRLQRFQLCK